MSKRRPVLLIQDMLDSAQKILTYTQGQTFDVFAADNKTIDAVVRNFEIIGEAANRLPEDFRTQYLSVDWQRIRGLRNRIVHNYFGIDNSIVWQIKEAYIPQLIDELNKIASALN